jgi:hypothetical protein
MAIGTPPEHIGGNIELLGRVIVGRRRFSKKNARICFRHCIFSEFGVAF